MSADWLLVIWAYKGIPFTKYLSVGERRREGEKSCEVANGLREFGRPRGVSILLLGGHFEI